MSETHELSVDSTYYQMKPKYAVPYQLSVEEQLRAWVAGDSKHNEFSDECCPDFSCCRPELQWSKESREAFGNADEGMREAMLTHGLTGLIAENAKTVYVAGTDNPIIH